MSPIISSLELSKIISNDKLLLLECSYGPTAKAEYLKDHIVGAVFVDLNTQLSEIKEYANGGRHPLPKIENFGKILSELGLEKNTHVVIYDRKNGASAAARLWWMLRSAGHEHVQVLNGGYQQALEIGIETTDTIPKVKSNMVYEVTDWQLPRADINEISEKSTNENYVLIDVREHIRYIGEQEPIDEVAGHIPGAINVPFSQNLDERGLFLSPEILKEKYKAILKEAKETTVHCGSGVTACHTLLAIAYAGLPIPKLYVGSWSEWSRNQKPIATGEA
jgi:thiosulfate/3-mercaptopyruvate sulfurtransferase